MFVGRQENDTVLSFSVAFERPERSPVSASASLACFPQFGSANVKTPSMSIAIGDNSAKVVAGRSQEGWTRLLSSKLEAVKDAVAALRRSPGTPCHALRPNSDPMEAEALPSGGKPGKHRAFRRHSSCRRDYVRVPVRE